MRKIIFLALFSVMMLGQMGYALELYYAKPKESEGSKLSGSIVGEVSYNRIGGNEGASAYKEGVDYFSQLSLSFLSSAFSDYTFEAKSTLRKTDSRTIDARRDVRIKNLVLKLYNDRSLFLFGDYFQDFSNYSLTNSLEGFYAKISPFSGLELKAVLGRSQRESSTVPQYQRNVFGLSLYKESLDVAILGMDSLKNTLSIVTSQDDSSTCGEEDAEDLDNTVVAWKLESMGEKGGFNSEVAYSAYIEDRNANKDRDWGWALRVNPFFSFEKGRFDYLFERVDPQFYTAQGSATIDKLRHQLRLVYDLTDTFSIDWTEDVSYDHLDGSSLSYRTTDWEHDVSLSFNSDDNSFGGSVYLNWLDTNSDDIANSEEARDITLGFNAYKSFDKELSVNFGYERRNYSNEANRSLSEYADIFSLGLAKNGLFHGRKYYFNPNLSVSYRRPKSSIKSDISFALGFSGTYELKDNVKLRAGLNLNEANGAEVDSDYDTKRSFFEWDWSFDDAKNRHLIFRIERNTHSYNDSTKDYEETRAIVKTVFDF